MSQERGEGGGDGPTCPPDPMVGACPRTPREPPDAFRDEAFRSAKPSQFRATKPCNRKSERTLSHSLPSKGA